MLNILFACYYNFFLKTKDNTPIFASVYMVSLLIVVWFFFFFILIMKTGTQNIFSNPISKYIYAVMHLILIALLYRFYSTGRVNSVIASFNDKSIFNKKSWFVFSAFLLVFPVVLIGFLLKK